MNFEIESNIPSKELYSSNKEKKMKKFVWFLSLILAFTVVLSACGTTPPTEAPNIATEAPAEATEAPAAAEPFRVAVVMPSATTDLAFSQSMYDALLRVQE